jgi:hypothetical protein
VRIRLDRAKDKTPKEILIEVRKYILGAYTIKKLNSGDIDIIVPSQAVKNRLLN